MRIACSRSADTACSSAALAASKRRPLAGAATRSPSAAKNLDTAASRPARRKSRTNCSSTFCADGEHAETVTVGEGEARRARRELVPEPPDTEPGLALVRVVEQEHAPVAQLGQPRRDVVGNGLVGVAAVDVKEIDRAVGEARRRLVEAPLEQTREGAVERVVVGTQLFEHLRAVRPGVLVALPAVDRGAARGRPERLDRLAERAVGVSLPRAELDDRLRAERLDRVKRKRDVFVPAVDVGEPPWRAVHERRAGREALHG